MWRINHAVTFNLTSTLTPSLVSTAHASWNRHQFAIHPYSFGYDPTALRIFGLAGRPIQSPIVSRGQHRRLQRLGTRRGPPQFQRHTGRWARVSKIVGKHTLKFGAEARDMFNNQANPSGFATFKFRGE